MICQADCLATLLIAELRMVSYPTCPNICTLLMSVIINRWLWHWKIFCILIKKKPLSLFNTLKLCACWEAIVCVVCVGMCVLAYLRGCISLSYWRRISCTCQCICDIKHHAYCKHVNLRGNDKTSWLENFPSTQRDMCNMKCFFEMDLRSVTAGWKPCAFLGPF